MLKPPVPVDDKFYPEELDLKGRTKIRISFFLFSLIVKSVCSLSVGEVEELTKHWAFDMIAKTSILFFFYFVGISVVYWIKDKTGEANALTLKVWQILYFGDKFKMCGCKMDGKGRCFHAS